MINAAALALVTLSAPAIVSPDALTSDVATANKWLEQLDAKSWNESWKGTGKLFQSNLTQEQWAKTAQAVRDPLGAVISRHILGVTKTKTLPGAPDGEYEVLTYSAVFTNKASAVETVVSSVTASNRGLSGLGVAFVALTSTAWVAYSASRNVRRR
jgi:hypothetical protein